MIVSFRCKETEALFNNKSSQRFQQIERAARKRLLYLNAARNLTELGMIPGNNLEALKGNRKGQYSIRINDQWRICFKWVDSQAQGVEIVDYH